MGNTGPEPLTATNRTSPTTGFRITILTPCEIEQSIRDLMAAVPFSLEELRGRAKNFTLSPQEQGVLDRVEDLVYLRDSTAVSDPQRRNGE